ncbi:MAG: maltose/maltodextrin ABC transporter substrate-binding protein MalE [Ruminobacter sp.]|jgi:maltose/maltodextrin transport system substrate-binding protein|uniref:Maltodextrin-binding protein n=1 Tax=Ruminobacter amylophilus TaxID=867 RepID=A0A662ZFU4_9GAMM|nr:MULTISPECIES: maltose/maltodextrin ABC transporter substrate-binding protein MalE [Ruminobacter]MBQ3775079.1 maltose/maltodextrin ABC transporter substrate-binding protein MalE [Ruminobacter sp.]SFP21060.1 maltose/maltodextrin transport system substrate-binding protein [Ruminobacter amylophilus]
MKKTILSAIIGLVTLGVSSVASAAGIEEGQLTIWVNGDKGYDGIAKVGARFTEATGVKVTVGHPDQVEVKFQQNAASGNGPDIFMWAHDRFGEWVQAGLLTEIVPTEDELNRFQKVAWDAMKVNGKYYAYPVSIEAIAMICNKDIVPEAPKTFEELAELDTKLQKEGKHAIMWDYNNAYFTYPLLSANGGFAFRTDAKGVYDVTKTGVNNEGAKKGLNYLVNMVKKGHIPKGADYGIMESSFVAGKVGCIINGAWAWGQYSKVNYSVNPFPTLDGKPGKPFVGVLGMAINHASPNKDLAKEFLLNYLLTDAGLEEVNNDKPLGAAALKSYEAKLESDPRIATTMENAKMGDIMPSVPEMNRFWSSLQTALKNATTGRQSVDDALSTAEVRIVKEKK